jgi:hypothetical protein
LIATLLLAGVAVSACGKKGPPLAPIAHVPAAVDQIAARRMGRDVYVTLTVPAKNIDATMPADVRRVEVYGVTSLAPPPRGRFLEMATLVATIPVAPPLEETAGDRGSAPADGTPQGTPVTFRDTLTADELVPKSAPASVPVRGRGAPRSLLGETAPASAPRQGPEVPRRFYMALGFSGRGRPGPPGTVLELPLIQLPDPPADLRVTYTSDMVALAWPPSGGILGFVTDRALPIEPPPFDDLAPPPAPGSAAPVLDVLPGPTRYNVYREVAPDPLVLPPSPAVARLRQADPAVAAVTLLPTPLTAQPVEALTFSDAIVEFERQQCYEIRAARGVAPQLVEGDPSPRVCVTPIDTFPPVAPSGLTAVAAEGAIGLLWEPNVDLDLGGYVVLRGKAGDATLLPLTDAPIVEARFTDKTVMPGVRYVYAVVAVDSRVPLPNVSDESARVEETAR